VNLNEPDLKLKEPALKLKGSSVYPPVADFSAGADLKFNKPKSSFGIEEDGINPKLGSSDLKIKGVKFEVKEPNVKLGVDASASANASESNPFGLWFGWGAPSVPKDGFVAAEGTYDENGKLIIHDHGVYDIEVAENIENNFFTQLIGGGAVIRVDTEERKKIARAVKIIVVPGELVPQKKEETKIELVEEKKQEEKETIETEHWMDPEDDTDELPLKARFEEKVVGLEEKFDKNNKRRPLKMHPYQAFSIASSLSKDVKGFKVNDNKEYQIVLDASVAGKNGRMIPYRRHRTEVDNACYCSCNVFGCGSCCESGAACCEVASCCRTEESKTPNEKQDEFVNLFGKPVSYNVCEDTLTCGLPMFEKQLSTDVVRLFESLVDDATECCYFNATKIFSEQV
jgi:hypothetical protein